MTHFVSVSLRDPARVPVNPPVSPPVSPSVSPSASRPASRPASPPVSAPEAAATCVLVMRKLLRERAAALGLPVRANAHPDTDDAGLSDDETLLEQLLDLEAGVPAPTEAECRRYYDAHPQTFRSGDLALVRHILFGVTAGVPVQALLARAEATLHELRAEPARFAERAAALSNCPSGKIGGSLGQIGRDDCVPEFAEAVFGTRAYGTEVSAPEGAALLPRLVRTRFGFHIVLVERRIDGVRLPFEMVQAQIARRLVEHVRLKAAQQYVRVLAASAAIAGGEFGSAASPLLQ